MGSIITGTGANWRWVFPKRLSEKLHKRSHYNESLGAQTHGRGGCYTGLRERYERLDQKAGLDEFPSLRCHPQALLYITAPDVPTLYGNCKNIQKRPLHSRHPR